MINEKIKKLMKEGRIRIRVKKAGMYQYQLFVVKTVPYGNKNSVELFLDKLLEIAESEKIANDIGIPVHTKNNRIFPKGYGAKDFIID